MIHPKQLLVVIACSAIAYAGRSQSLKRGLIAKAANKVDSSENPHRYEILVLNPTDSIAYITHSYTTLLVEGLAPDVNLLTPVSYERDTATYALYYSARDSQFDHEGSQRPKLASFLLPHQVARFSIALVKYSKRNQLLIEYILLPDFCYQAAIKETQGNSNWWSKYKKQFLKIPFERKQ